MNTKLHFEIYDHFGLDAKDITGFKELHNGFASWYILQHYGKYIYKPFITKLLFIKATISNMND